MSPSSAAAWSARVSRWRCAARRCACCSSKACRRIPPRSRASTSAPPRSATARGRSSNRWASGPRWRREAAPIRSIHVSDAGRFGVARLDAQEQGVPRVRLRRAEPRHRPRVVAGAARRAQHRRSRCRRSSRARRCATTACCWTSSSTATPRQMRAAVAVAADGAGSVLRASAGIEADVEDYDQVAIVVNAATERPNNGEAFERFTPSGPLAVLPVTGGGYAVVWAVKPERAAELRVARRSRVRGRAAAPPSAGAPAAGRASAGATPIRSRCRAPPRPSPGAWCSSATPRRRCTRSRGRDSISGLRDAATLAEMLAASGRRRPRRTPNCWRKFAAWRAEDRSGVTRFTDGLVKLFGSDSAGPRAGAQFRPAAVRPEPGGQARAVARELGIRRAACRASRAACRSNEHRRTKWSWWARGPSASPPPCCSRGRRAFRAARIAVFDRRIPDSLDRARAASRRPARVRAVARQRADPARRGCVGRHRRDARRALRTHAGVARRRAAAWRRRAGVRCRRDGRARPRRHRREQRAAGRARRRRAPRRHRTRSTARSTRSSRSAMPSVLHAGDREVRARLVDRRGWRAVARARARGARRPRAPTTARPPSSRW